MDGLRAHVGYGFAAFVAALLLVGKAGTGSSGTDAVTSSAQAAGAEKEGSEARPTASDCLEGRHLLNEYRSLYGPPGGPALAFRTLVVLVPDPMETGHTESFDSVLEGVEQAIALGRGRTKYVRDRHWLPWPGKDTAKAALHCWEKQPGIIVYRPSGENADLASPFAVLVVGETPTWGLRVQQFEAAMKLATALAPFDDLAILGPASSGTAASLAAAIRGLLREGTIAKRITVASGTASDRRVRAIVEAAGPGVTYSSAAADYTSLLEAMSGFLRARGGRCGDVPGGGNIVLFTESLTTYGSLLTDECFGHRTFPPNLESIRRAYEGVQGSVLATAPAARVPLVKGSDPTSVAHDIALGEELREIGSGGLLYAGIAATDARDVVFMAERIRRQLPDVRLFTLRANILYLHPKHARSLNGMIVAHSAPMGPGELGFASREVEMVHDVYRAGRSLVEGHPALAAKIQLSFIGNGHLWRIDADSPPGTAPAPVLWSFKLFVAICAFAAVLLLVFVLPRFTRWGRSQLVLIGRCRYEDLGADDRWVTVALVAVSACPVLLFLVACLAAELAATWSGGLRVCSLLAPASLVLCLSIGKRASRAARASRGTVLLTVSAMVAAILAVSLATGPQSEATFHLMSGGSPLIGGLIAMGSFALALWCARVRLRQLDTHCFGAGGETTFAEMPPPIAQALGEWRGGADAADGSSHRSGLADSEIDLLAVIRSPWAEPTCGIAIAVHVLLALSIAAMCVVKQPRTLEEGWRNWALVAFGCTAMLPIVGSLARLLATAVAFRRFSRHLVGTRAARALKRLPCHLVRPLEAQLASTGCHTTELVHPVEVLGRLAGLTPELGKAHQECVALLRHETARESVRSGLRPERTKLARLLVETAGDLAGSEAHHDAPVRKAIDDLRASLIAVFLPRYVRHFRLFAPPLLIGSILSVFMTSLYFVHPQHLIASIIFVWVVAIALSVAGSYLALDRDPIISTMCRSNAGEVTVNWALFRRFLAWVAVPLIGLLAAQFPQFTFWLSDALEWALNGFH